MARFKAGSTFELTRLSTVRIQHVGVAAEVLQLSPGMSRINLDGEVPRWRPVPVIGHLDSE